MSIQKGGSIGINTEPTNNYTMIVSGDTKLLGSVVIEKVSTISNFDKYAFFSERLFNDLKSFI